MSDVECPYCGADVEINHDDGAGYAEDCLHHQDCPECDKTFVFQTTIVLYYDAKTADCLNGGEHDYKKTDTIPERFARLRCETCGDEKPLPANAGVTGAEPKAERPC